MSSIEYKKYKDFSKFPIDSIVKASFQRNINKKHIGSIVKYILSCNEEPILGCIELAHYASKIFIIDGQHRLAAIMNCYENYETLIPIHTFNYTINTEKEMEEIFRMRNMNLEVADYIRKGEEISLREMCNMLQEKWPDIFTTTRCQRPRINIDIFLEKLKKVNAKDMSLDDFSDYVDKMNIFCKDIVENMNEDDLIKAKLTSNILEKFRKYDCYLGYDTKFSYLM